MILLLWLVVYLKMIVWLEIAFSYCELKYLREKERGIIIKGLRNE